MVDDQLLWLGDGNGGAIVDRRGERRCGREQQGCEGEEAHG